MGPSIEVADFLLACRAKHVIMAWSYGACSGITVVSAVACALLGGGGDDDRQQPLVGQTSLPAR